MSVKIIKQDELDQVGFRMYDGKIHEFKGKLYTSVYLGKEEDAKMKSIYVVTPLQMGNSRLVGQPIPKDWVFLELYNADKQETFYMLGTDEVSKPKKKQYDRMHDSLPAAIGDSIRLKDREGKFEVAFAHPDVVLVINDELWNDYTQKKTKTPTIATTWQNVAW